MNDSWTINAYTFKAGYYQLAEFASGLSHFHADKFFKQLRDTNKFAKLEMVKLPE
tara:strand:+ start:302 stop:466 length:165 start_codon:yes stop_codon:yes gene_type:complete